MQITDYSVTDIDVGWLGEPLTLQPRQHPGALCTKDLLAESSGKFSYCLCFHADVLIISQEILGNLFTLWVPKFPCLSNRKRACLMALLKWIHGLLRTYNHYLAYFKHSILAIILIYSTESLPVVQKLFKRNRFKVHIWEGVLTCAPQVQH